MIAALHLIIAFTASVVGAISGIGGGIIIKPVLDTLGFFDIAVINFLSGTTVLTMAGVSLLGSRKTEISINRRVGSMLAAGGIIGGLSGKIVLNFIITAASHPENVKSIQSVILTALTILVLVFTLNKRRIRPLPYAGNAATVIIGFGLGLTGAFLGIGGGPINLLVLYIFFSMESKTAALNSLFIIFFSQFASLLISIAGGTVPDFDIRILCMMILGGVSGAFAGTAVSRRLSHSGVDRLFIAVLIIISIISGRNILI